MQKKFLIMLTCGPAPLHHLDARQVEHHCLPLLAQGVKPELEVARDAHGDARSCEATWAESVGLLRDPDEEAGEGRWI